MPFFGGCMRATAHPSAPVPCAPEAAVPQELVHKVVKDEVLLTGWHTRDTSTHAFTVTAQWPRDHSFYTTRHQLHDPLLLAETVRQAIPLLSHAVYQVPVGFHLAWDRLSYRLGTAALRVAAVPTELTLHITCSDVELRRGGLSSLNMTVSAERDGARLGDVSTRFSSYAPAIYQRLRGGRTDAVEAVKHAVELPLPLAPHLVARTRSEDVVLARADTPNRWQLRTDTTHPILFDHPVDHAPGMLLLEAARQAAHAACYPHLPVILGLDTTFIRYAELDAPCWIQATPLRPDLLGRPRIRVTASQHGEEVFTADVTTTHSRVAADAAG
ncbi:ScbA/BarX family gamma-butyrolactone biosynthesis protein [Streptacidiphilus sp. PAMC 29251]